MAVCLSHFTVVDNSQAREAAKSYYIFIEAVPQYFLTHQRPEVRQARNEYKFSQIVQPNQKVVRCSGPLEPSTVSKSIIS